MEFRFNQRFSKKIRLLIPATLAMVALSNFSQYLVSFESSDSATKTLLSQWSANGGAQAQLTARSDWSHMEQAILAEHNRVRQNPQSYIPVLEAYLSRMTSDGHIIHGCGHNCVLATREGRAAVQEAIDFLREQPAVSTLAVSMPVARAAKSHAHDQRNGATGHVSSDGTNFSQRLSQFGVQTAAIGENIAYGATSAEQVVMNLIVDDGVPSRGHRTNIFASNWAVAGAGCGDHATYRTVCVVDYATR